MNRRGFLQSVAVAPIAAPEAIKEVVSTQAMGSVMGQTSTSAAVSVAKKWYDGLGLNTNQEYACARIEECLTKIDKNKIDELYELMGLHDRVPRYKPHIKHLKSVSDQYKEMIAHDNEKKLSSDSTSNWNRRTIAENLMILPMPVQKMAIEILKIGNK